MLQSNKQVDSYFHRFMLFFIVLQPVLDLLTSFCILQLNMSATIGVFVRFVVMIMVGGYILLQWKGSKRYIAYFVVLGVILAIGLVNNILVKDPISISEEIKFIAKIVYVLVMLVGYIFVFRALKSEGNGYQRFRDYVVYSAVIINLVMVVSMLTGTDYRSYDYTKLGSKGWFFAANDLSIILAITFPIVVLYSIQKTTAMAKAYYWIPTLLSVYSLIAVGTKVGYGAMVGVLLVAVVMCAAGFIMESTKSKKATLFLNGIFSIVLLVGLGLSIKQTPIYKNMYLHIDIMDWKKAAEGPKEEEETQEEKRQEYVEGLIFSGRDMFLHTQQEYFKEAPFSQKMLGMGYAGNYKEEPKMIEMDFHDMFYSFGVIGFLALLLPLLYFGIRIFIVFIKRFKMVFNVKYALLSVSAVLALGIAYTAGHVFTSPSVSIYFSLVLAYLIVDLKLDGISKK
jgi:O-antigen ligase like membrane protein